MNFTLGTLANHRSVTLTVVVHPTGQVGDSVTNTANVTSAVADPNTSDNSAPASFVLQPNSGGTRSPRVLKLQRFGFHSQPTLLVLSLSDDLDPSTARRVGYYRLVSPGPDHRFGTSDDSLIPVSSAVYDPARRTVTLRPARRLSLVRVFQLTVDGSGRAGAGRD